MERKCLITIAGLLVFSALNSAFAQSEGSWKLSTGFDFSSGDYGQSEDTEILYLPLTAKYTLFPWTLKLTVPYLSIDSPANVTIGPDGRPLAGSEGNGTSTQDGLGDIIGSAGYSIDPWTDGAPFIDLTGKIKFPTAKDEDDLGTGEFDYTVQVDVAKKWGDLFPFVTLGYQFLGSNSDFNLDNRLKVSVGVDYTLADPYNIGLIYDFKQASSDRGDDQQELVGYINWKANDTWSLNTYGVAGFSDASPDYGVGLQVGYKL